MYVTWESCRKPYRLTQAYAYIKLTIHWNTTPSYTPWMKVQLISSFILWVLLSSVHIITSTLGTMVTPSLPVVNIQCLRYKCHALCRFCVILMILKNWTMKTKNRKYQVYNQQVKHSSIWVLWISLHFPFSLESSGALRSQTPVWFPRL